MVVGIIWLSQHRHLNILRFCSVESIKTYSVEVQYNSHVGQYLAHDEHCWFLETSPNSSTSTFPTVRTVFFGFLTESVASFLCHSVGSDRVCSIFRSERFSPLLESRSPFLGLQVLHFVELLEHEDQC